MDIDKVIEYKNDDINLFDKLKDLDLEKLNSIKNNCKIGFYSKEYIEILTKFLDPLILKKTRFAKLIRLNEIANEPELLEFFPEIL